MSRLLRLVRRTGAALLVFAAALCVVGLAAGPAAADPADPCALLRGHMKDACDATQKLVTNPGAPASPGVTDWATDPLGAMAKAMGQGAAWLIDKVGVITDSVGVDFTNRGWLVVYAIVFGASTILTAFLWMLAVIRRVIRAEKPEAQVVSAVGGLWISVLAAAFTPLVLASLVKITDELTEGLRSGVQNTLAQIKIIPSTDAGPSTFLGPVSASLRNGGDNGGGPWLFMFVALLTTAVSLLLWLELLARVSMLYVGGALAPAVMAGLVDKDLWAHIRRWMSMILAIDLIKPFLMVVLLIGEAVTATAPTGGIESILGGTSVLWVAVFGQAMIYRLIPGLGDDLAYGRQLRRGHDQARMRPTLSANTGAAGVAAGIGAHAERGGSGGLGRIADMTVRMQPGSGSSGSPPEASRMRPEPPAPRPPSGGGG